MDSELCVTCHAPSLSLLLFETVRSARDQRGLLIGEVCKEVILEKTDENEMNREQRTTIYLEHCVPVKDNDLFGTIGNINKQKLQKYIDQYCGKIVGWYSFRRNTKVNLRTLQEILIHKSLIQSISHIRPEHFVAAFLSASIGAHSFTHSYNHVFTRFHPVKGIFEPLKLKIFTMSDKRVNVNSYSIRNEFPTSSNFENIINQSEKEASPVMSVLTINKSIGEYSKQLEKQLQDAETIRFELEREIIRLRKRLLLDKFQDIEVGKLNREKEPSRVQFVRYNANVNYIPEDVENPGKIFPFHYAPRVPDESGENGFVKTETKKPASSNSESDKNRLTGKVPQSEMENKGEFSSTDSKNPEGCGKTLDEAEDSVPDSEESSSVQLEKSKVSGSV